MTHNATIRSKHSSLLSGCRRTAERRGAAVVEFAVVAPVLLLLLLGMIECGRMIMVQQTITTAAREGARSAIVEGTSAATATTSVQSFLAGTGIRGAQITVAPNNTGSVAHGQPITVTVFRSVQRRELASPPLLLRPEDAVLDRDDAARNAQLTGHIAPTNRGYAARIDWVRSIHLTRKLLRLPGNGRAESKT